MKYKVYVKELCWYDSIYIIDSEENGEDAEDLIESGDCDCYSNDYDCTDQIDILKIEKYED